MSAPGRPAASLRPAWLWACGLDVAVRKPGNVSVHSAGHRMQAEQFLASAAAAADALCDRRLGVGARIEAAVAATRAAVGCNTNLGIVLLCVPLAVAWERAGGAGLAGLRTALDEVLRELDVDDARAAYRAIALASPAGLGRVQAQDVHEVPQLGLRDAMALAAERDSIARQYRDGFRDILDEGLRALRESAAPGAMLGDAVQHLYLSLLARWPDSHIVRKLGAGVAHTVTDEAARWLFRLRDDFSSGRGAEFAAWDKSLKERGINPGSSADMTVATLFCAALLAPECIRKEASSSWHGICIDIFRDERQPVFARPDPLGGKPG